MTNSSLIYKLRIVLFVFVTLSVGVFFISYKISKANTSTFAAIGVVDSSSAKVSTINAETVALALKHERVDKLRSSVKVLHSQRLAFLSEVSGKSNFSITRYRDFFAETTEEDSGKVITFKQTSLRPRNLANSPDDFEKRVLNLFKEDSELLEYSELVSESDGSDYLRYVKPLYATNTCLSCHGARNKIPASIKGAYPDDRAYGYEKGDIIGAVSVKMPVLFQGGDGRAVIIESVKEVDSALKLLSKGGVVNVDGKDVYIPKAESESLIGLIRLIKNNWTKLKLGIEIIKKNDVDVTSVRYVKSLESVSTSARLMGSLIPDLSRIYKEEAQLAIVKYEMFRTALLVSIILIVLGAMWFAKQYIINPIEIISQKLKNVSSGDLTDDIEVNATSEIAMIVDDVKKMDDGLRGLLGAIIFDSKEILRLSNSVEQEHLMLLETAQVQEASAEKIRLSAEEKNISIKLMAAGTQKLTAIEQGVSSSVLELTASIDEVAKVAEDLSYTVDEVSSSISEMATSVKEISTHTSQLSYDTNDTAEAVSDITVKINEIEKNLQTSSKLAETTALEAQSGSEAVNKTIDAMWKIKDTVGATADSIKSLGEQSGAIGSILNVINDVAEQTNLLALNAAIIAAQAGEHGKSFAVVADEIKDLADRTTVSTREIESVIHSVQQEADKAVKMVESGAQSVDDGVELSQLAGETLEKILSSANVSKQTVGELGQSSAEQLKGIQQVNDSMDNVTTMLKKVYNAIEDQEKGSTYIAKAAEKMKDAAAKLNRATKEQSVGGANITKGIGEISKMVASIDAASQEQAQGTQVMVGEITNIKVMIDKNTVSFSSIHKSFDKLKDLAQELEENAAKFKIK